MKRKILNFLLLVIGFGLVAGGCTNHDLPREVPSSPVESYQSLPE